MWRQYLFVFSGTLLMDVLPIPLPPAFAVMVFLQISFHLNIWAVIGMGVAGSIAGRYILTLYMAAISAKLFTRAKNQDVEYLGELLKTRGWAGQTLIFAYALLPLPTTPLFIAGGMAKMKPRYLIPAFACGKLISDTMAVLMGRYAADNITDLAQGLVSWSAVGGLGLALLLMGAILFVDWRVVLRQRRFKLSFRILK